MIKKNLPIETLIEAYLTQRVVVVKEDILDKLVNATTNENYLLIIEILRGHDDLHPLELSLYINEIAKPEFSGLSTVIQELLKLATDRDVVEDLNEALDKIQETKSADEP